MVSIIVPIYNGSIYINEFYRSCTNQIYTDFEIVFVDDGSNDESLDMLNDLKETSKLKIQVIHQKNQGVSSARNTGIRFAKGEYICFCDIDDEIADQYLEEMIKQYKINNADLVISQMKFLKQNKNINPIKCQNKGYNVKVLNQIDALEEYLYSKFQAGCCTILLKRSMLIENEIFFPVNYKYNEDIYTLWRILSCSNRTVIMDKQLYFYKQHSETAMNKFNFDRLDGLELMKKLEKYFSTNNPEFYEKYKKYGVARIAWSLSWQAAIFMNYDEYRDFLTKNNLKTYCNQLITYPQFKVAVSSIIMLLNPRIFRWIALKNKPYRYK